MVVLLLCRFGCVGITTGLTNTHTARRFSVLYHVFARKQCSVCRHNCYLTLPYVTSLRDSFWAWNFHARLYYAAASQPRVFGRLLLAISFAPQRSNKQSWFASNKYDLGLKSTVIGNKLLLLSCVTCVMGIWCPIEFMGFFTKKHKRFPHFTSVRTNNSTRLRLGWTFS